MINLLKIIQIIICTTVMIPTIYLIIKEMFSNIKKYKKRRLSIYGLIFLIFTLVFIILSIIISYNDKLYMSMKYAPFIQSWIVIKSTLLVYVQIILFIIGIIGFYGLFILICEKRVNKKSYELIDCNIPKKLTLRQKIEYPFMWYELYINVKVSQDNYYILTELATKDLIEFEAKEK